MSGKWLELLKGIAPHTDRVMILMDAATPTGPGHLVFRC
jgi:hypothetical protein